MQFDSEISKKYKNFAGFFSKPASFASAYHGVLKVYQHYSGDKSMTQEDFEAFLKPGSTSPTFKLETIDATWGNAFSLPNKWVNLDPFNSEKIILSDKMVKEYNDGKYNNDVCALYGTDPDSKIYDLLGCVYWGIIQLKKQDNLTASKFGDYWKKLVKAIPSSKTR